MYDLIIRDATIIHSGGRLVADIAVEDGRIAYVGGSAGGPAKEEVNGIGRFVIPGVIDSNLHCRNPDDPSKDDWVRASTAAVAQGITTILDMPDSHPATNSVERLKTRAAAAKKSCLANYGLWLGANGANVDDLRRAWDEGLSCGTYVHMDLVDGELGQDEAALEAVFQEGRGLIGVRAEDPKVLARNARKWAEVEDPIHNDVRPPKAAGKAVEHLIELVRDSQRSVHIASLSTATELNLLDPYRGELPITCGVILPHLFLSVETAGKLTDVSKCNPPVRTELDRRALWAAVKRGRIDTFGSGHMPLREKYKKKFEYWDMPPGLPGVELLVPLLMSGVKHGRVGLERMVQMCCEAPAKIFGLEGKGRLEVGADADLLLFPEGETNRLRKPPKLSGANWTPYIGREVGVPPELVLVMGRIAARDGVPTEGLPPGQALRFERD